MPEFYTWAILLINQSEEIGEKQLIVLGSRCGKKKPLNARSPLESQSDIVYPAIQLRLPCTPPPPRTNFHGCQIVHWDPLDAKRRCPQKQIGLGYVNMHGFHGNP